MGNQGNQSNFNMGGMGGFNQPKPPIPFNQSGFTEVIAQGQKYVGESKKIMEKMKSEHFKAIEKIQHLQTIKESVESEEAHLSNQNVNMSKYLRVSESSGQGNLSSLIKPKTEISEQMLDLISSMKARDECILLLENKFNQEELRFDEFMKNFRRIE